MPIKYNDNQTVVSCTGDVLVLTFSPKLLACDGTAWLLMQEREEGQIGRQASQEILSEKLILEEQPGVLIGAKNSVSLDVIIEALIKLRDDLLDVNRKSVEIKEYQMDGKIFLSGLRFTTEATYHLENYSKVRVCIWPPDVEPMIIIGKIVVIDGDLMGVVALDPLEHIDPVDPIQAIHRNKPIGIIAQPFVNKKESFGDEIL